MTRRRPRTTYHADRIAGVLATWGGTCDVCGREVHRCQVVNHHGRWIHTACAPGADDA